MASVEDAENSPKERGQWSRQLDFFLSCLGYAVGLGNVWRFPYLCYKNGGGAFLIPYVIMLALCGLPIFFLELAVGQYHGNGPNIVFKHLAPAFHGLGYAMLVVSLLVLLYYNMIIAWSFFYMFATFTSELGWASCGHEWNTPNCLVSTEKITICRNESSQYNVTCFGNDCKNISFVEDPADCISEESRKEKISSSEEYFLHYMLGISPGIETFGNLRWQLVLCLMLSWIVVGLCLIKGVRSSGKVVYFTALFPYVVLVILLIRGATLDGAADGVYFYIVPNWEKLTHAQAWGDAAVQIFFSLGPGFGGLLTLSSYNKFHNNCYRDAILIALSNCGTSVFAGFVIFSILGSMARSLGVPVDEVIKSGPGLAFIAYPEAVTQMPLSQLWAFLFFFMLITLGLDSQFTMCETMITAAQDEWPILRNHKSKLVIGSTVLFFLLGLPFCAEGGVYIFTLVDWYAGGWSLLIICLFELVLISWVYGVKNFLNNISDMIDKNVSWYWGVCWKYLSPITIVGILIFNFVNYSPTSFGDYKFPVWANVLGFLMVAASTIMIPVFAVYQLYKTKKETSSFRPAFRPTPDWGPAEKEVVSPAKTLQVTEITSNDSQSKPVNGLSYFNRAYSEDDAKG